MFVSAPAYKRLGTPLGWRATLQLKTVTPLYGGSAQLREIVKDDPDPVRAPGIRGQLRLFWRALYGPRYPTAAALYGAERSLWGGMGQAKEGASRSQVEVFVKVLTAAGVETDNPKEEESYALWPARGQTKKQIPTLPRRKPGLCFDLSISCREDQQEEVTATLQAWVLFGGVGGRTRRGCGSVAFVDTKKTAGILLPSDGAAILALCAARTPHERSFPVLSGASCFVGPPEGPLQAWLGAIGWLRAFRQGYNRNAVDIGSPGDHAREHPKKQPGEKDPFGRAGQSRWPEADKIRHLTPRQTAHPPRYKDTAPAWPRAAFGLPLQFRFQSEDRYGNRYAPLDPDEQTLYWHDGKEVRDRLPSPLILKAVQLADGRFVPVALWLERALPQGAQVGLEKKTVGQSNKALLPKSVAPLDRMFGEKDAVLFRPLEGHPDVRSAFFAWLEDGAGGAL